MLYRVTELNVDVDCMNQIAILYSTKKGYSFLFFLHIFISKCDLNTHPKLELFYVATKKEIKDDT